MNSRRPILNIVWKICAAALLCAAAGVPAQTIYKQVDAAGHATYTDRPDATLPYKQVDAAGHTPYTDRPDWTPPPQAATVPVLDVTSALASNSAMSSRGAAVIDANEAARRLRQAKLEREQGAERLPGEAAHGADGSVANQRYRQRQEELLRVVVLAQRRSSDTVRSLGARR